MFDHGGLLGLFVGLGERWTDGAYREMERIKNSSDKIKIKAKRKQNYRKINGVSQIDGYWLEWVALWASKPKNELQNIKMKSKKDRKSVV